MTSHGDRTTISSVAGKEHSRIRGDENHVFDTIQEAVRTAVDIWTRYEELSAAIDGPQKNA